MTAISNELCITGVCCNLLVIPGCSGCTQYLLQFLESQPMLRAFPVLEIVMIRVLVLGSLVESIGITSADDSAKTCAIRRVGFPIIISMSMVMDAMIIIVMITPTVIVIIVVVVLNIMFDIVLGVAVLEVEVSLRVYHLPIFVIIIIIIAILYYVIIYLQGQQCIGHNILKNKNKNIFKADSPNPPAQQTLTYNQQEHTDYQQNIITQHNMDSDNLKHACNIIHPSYATLGYNSLQTRIKVFKQMLTQRQLPDQGLDQLTIEYIMNELALMDSNNFHHKIGVGQREARVYSSLVQRRNFHMGHGIGRSGDVMANQPKAAGSSLLLQLTKFMLVSALKQATYDFVKDVLLLPMATGMALTMVFLTLAEKHPQKKYVIWSRIDQKTCLKSIITANLIPVVVEEILVGDAVCCSHDAIEQKIKQLTAEKVLCVVSTTSCFAPRIPDDVSINAQIAKKNNLFHVVNNAYGIWCTKIAHQIKTGMQNGEVTAVVQSMDKNFMVPVGGAFIFTQKQATLKQISGKYPGRASSSPIVDLFLTLLAMGKNNLIQLKKQRKQQYKYLQECGEKFAKGHNFRILKTEANTISIAMQLKDLKVQKVTELGAILYSKRVMGHRIIAQSSNKTKIGGFQFSNYGSHCQKYPYLPYITFACAIGTQKQEIDEFFKRLEQSIIQLTKKSSKKQANKQTSTNMNVSQKQKTVMGVDVDVDVDKQIQRESAQIRNMLIQMKMINNTEQQMKQEQPNINIKQQYTKQHNQYQQSLQNENNKQYVTRKQFQDQPHQP